MSDIWSQSVFDLSMDNIGVKHSNLKACTPNGNKKWNWDKFCNDFEEAGIPKVPRSSPSPGYWLIKYFYYWISRIPSNQYIIIIINIILL